MSKRKVIKIDGDKCNGCGQCIPNCPEGALQIIDGKARLVSDLFCDGLGACIGYCPQGAITIEEREAEAYDEKKVMANVVKQGKNVIKAHLQHLKGHHQHEYLNQASEYLKEKGIKVPRIENHGSSCPGSNVIEMKKESAGHTNVGHAESRLGNWPVQIALVPAIAPFLQGADLLIAADCVPFAYADFHEDLADGKVVLVGCPKLDNIESYKEKIKLILQFNAIKSITYAHMEVPCCFGLLGVIKSAIADSGKHVPFSEVTISVKGGKS